jgi:hypothetical protein
MGRRGERVAPPPVPGGWDLRFGDSEAAAGWDDLCARAPGPARDAWEILTAEPRRRTHPHRQHRLAGNLGSRVVGGEELEQWQYEITGAGRLWYCIDDVRQRVILVFARSGHPRQTS